MAENAGSMGLLDIQLVEEVLLERLLAKHQPAGCLLPGQGQLLPERAVRGDTRTFANQDDRCAGLFRQAETGVAVWIQLYAVAGLQAQQVVRGDSGFFTVAKGVVVGLDRQVQLVGQL